MLVHWAPICSLQSHIPTWYNFKAGKLRWHIIREWNYISESVSRVSTGIPGYSLRKEMNRKFFPFPLRKRFRKSGIPERFPERVFFRKPEISGTLFWNYGTLRNSVPENSGLWNNCSGIFRKKVPENVEDILNVCKRWNQ